MDDIKETTESVVTPIAAPLEFEQKLKQNTFETVVPELSRHVIKSLYSRLQESGQSFEATDFDFASGLFNPRSEGGGIFSVSCKNGEEEKRLSIFVGSTNKIIGYGGFTKEKAGDTRVFFKIFPEGRGTFKAAQKLFSDNLFDYLTTNPTTPDRLIVPTNQQYNPKIEQPTSAPIFYRTLGFTSKEDAKLPPELNSKVETVKQGGRAQFSPEEYIELSQNTLSMGIPKETIEQIKLTNFARIMPISERTKSTLTQVAQRNGKTQGLTRARLEALRTKIAQT